MDKDDDIIARLPVEMDPEDSYMWRGSTPGHSAIDFCSLGGWFSIPRGVKKGDILILSKPDGQYAYRVYPLHRGAYDPEDWAVEDSDGGGHMLYVSFERWLREVVPRDMGEAWIAFECYG